MARIRTIKPEFFTSERVAQLTPLARLLFVGLWTVADREGRLEDRPSRLRVQLLPYDNCDTQELLQEIAAAGFVKRYSLDGKNLIQIMGFLEHQRPHPREPESTLPVFGREKKRRAVEKNGEPLKDHVEPGGSGKGREGDLGREGEGKVTEDDFVSFWSAYPRKVAKKDAEVAWLKMKPPLDHCLETLSWQRRSPGWVKDGGQFVPHPATWINRRGWEDEPPTAAATSFMSEKELRTRVAAANFVAKGNDDAGQR